MNQIEPVFYVQHLSCWSVSRAFLIRHTNPDRWETANKEKYQTTHGSLIHEPEECTPVALVQVCIRAFRYHAQQPRDSAEKSDLLLCYGQIRKCCNKPVPDGRPLSKTYRSLFWKSATALPVSSKIWSNKKYNTERIPAHPSFSTCPKLELIYPQNCWLSTPERITTSDWFFRFLLLVLKWPASDGT